MAQRVEKHLALLHLLAETTDTQRLAIIKTFSPSQIRVVLEAIYNVLRGTCPVSDKARKALYHQRVTIRRLVSKDLSSQQRQRLLIRHSKLLPLLFKPVLEFFQSRKAPERNDG